MALQATRATLRGASVIGRGLLVLALAGMAGCDKQAPTLDVIRAGGELRIATVVSGTTYYESALGPAGFEHDLATRFASWLGVRPRFVIAEGYRGLRRMLDANKAHVAAALLTVDALDDVRLRYGPSYAIARVVVVHRRGRVAPRSVDDLRGLDGAALDGRGMRELISRNLPRAAGFRWTLDGDATADDLLEAVEDGRLDYAIVTAFDFDSARPYRPELLSLLDLGAPQAVAWLYRPGIDDSLGKAQLAFLRELRASGELATLEARYFAAQVDFDYVASRALLRDYDERLPHYRDEFIAMAAQTGLDWTLIAAVAYQESRWQEDARSPTGVRGLMMLTRKTAAAYGVDRLDGADSIRGGALYLANCKSRLPARIREPDRTSLALAAYNLGIGHLEDARVLTARAGRNPDRWADVREFLPRLAKRQWARRARHGFARGYQAVHFVDNTRRYADVLRWLEAETVPPAPAPTALAPSISPAL
ncbi:MAG: membrane-bound lytic murein transglycosylase MltF [Gammaproteobacteria bacterium]